MPQERTNGGCGAELEKAVAGALFASAQSGGGLPPPVNR